VSQPSEFEARLAAVEADAAATRHLAAARDVDLADLTVKVEAHRSAINALGVQTAARFDRLESRFDRLEGRFDRLEGRVDRLERKVDDGFAEAARRFGEMDRGFAEIRGRLDATAAWQERIVGLLTRLIDER
jgi:hypothetical protein